MIGGRLVVQATLIGYNVPKSSLDAAVSAIREARAAIAEQRQPDLEILGKPDLDSLTPEVLSAACARVSRNPRSLLELIEEAGHDVARARTSNGRIVFGIGHKSVAEHGVLNYAIEGISRLAVETIQDHRLASFTEKSQRYITLEEGDAVLPDELLVMGSGIVGRVHELLAKQAQLYSLAMTVLSPYVLAQFNRARGRPDGEIPHTKEEQHLVETAIKEDSRYSKSLSTRVQMGMTVNARQFEHMAMKGQVHPLAEVREIARQIIAQAQGVAPSLVPYTDPEAYCRVTGRQVDDEFLRTYRTQLRLANEQAAEIMRGMDGLHEISRREMPAVKLIKSTPRGEEEVLAALLQEMHGVHPEVAFAIADNMVTMKDSEEAKKYLGTLLANLGPHDAVPRAFEHAQFIYHVVLSASAYAQFKRHRMMTRTPYGYDPSLGVTIPPAIIAVGLDDEFEHLLNQGSALYEEIRQQNPDAAEYILSNAHRRPVRVTINARQLIALSRQRQDGHAQWDVRGIIDEMVGQARSVTPLLIAYAGGKDQYTERKRITDQG
jgi:thymidylate synthase ThyX